MAASIVLALVISAAEGGIVRLHAAGSPKAALTRVARAFTSRYGIEVSRTFSASVRLRQQLEQGKGGAFIARVGVAFWISAVL